MITEFLDAPMPTVNEGTNTWDEGQAMGTGGWGFGVSIVTRRVDRPTIPGRYGWDGGYGTSWYSDPEEEMVRDPHDPTGLGFPPNPPGVHRDFWPSAYQAIDD